MSRASSVALWVHVGSSGPRVLLGLMGELYALLRWIHTQLVVVPFSVSTSAALWPGPVDIPGAVRAFHAPFDSIG